LRDRPIRADRSRALHDEPGGRLDRLDVWVIVVLIASILTLRMWRLEQPYTMHFDEVYHARTATEFLQDWRYGISHDIYEWTHPHLAKYAMALGLVAFGDDRVASRSSLGVSVTAAAVEPRWDDRDTATARQGDRLFVATGSEIRAYDMATEALVARVPLPGAAAIDVDTSGHRVVVGTTSGAILTIDTTLLDDARLTGAAPDVTAVDFAHLDGPVRAIHVTNDGSAIVVGLDQDRIVTVDGLTAEELGRQTVPGYGQMTDAGSTGVVVASIALRTWLDDQPGQLHALTELLAAARINILHVGIHRLGPYTALGRVGLDLIVETRDREHAEGVLDVIRRAGYPAEESLGMEPPDLSGAR